MASKFEHMGYIGVAVIQDPERVGRTLTRVFTSPNPPKDYLKQRQHSGAEAWTLIYDELAPNIDGKFGVLEFINTNKSLKDLLHKTNQKLSTDAYFNGSPDEIVSIITSCVKASNDALVRNDSILATHEQLVNDTDFQQFAEERLTRNSNNELLFAGGSILETKIIDTMRVIKESKYPLTLAAITKLIYGKGKNEFISNEEKEKTKDVLNILSSSQFLQIVEKEDGTSRFSSYPAFKIAQLKLLSNSLPSLNIMGQLAYLFDKNADKPNDKTPYLTDPELEKKERITRLNERVKEQLKLYIDSDAFKKEKDQEFIQGVKNLITDTDARLDVSTLNEALVHFNKFTPEQKKDHKRMYDENLKDVVDYQKRKILSSLSDGGLLTNFNSKDIENAKKVGDFNLLEADKAGYVYVLYHRNNQIFKIGETSRSPQGRANELSAMKEMPDGWRLALKPGFDGYVFTEDRQLLEALLHARFKTERFNKSREFFRPSSQTDKQFFDTVSAEVESASFAVRDFHHKGSSNYPFIQLAKEELESKAKEEAFKSWKENKDKQEEEEFFKVAGGNINNRYVDPVKEGKVNENYENPLLVPILQIMHYNFARKDLKENLRGNPRTNEELKEQLTVFYPELSSSIKNENFENALDLIRTIDPPVIKESIREHTGIPQIRFTPSIDQNLLDKLNDQLPKIGLKEKIGYMLEKTIPESVEKRFLISGRTPALMAALKADKTNKSLPELANELNLYQETVKDLMEGLQKEVSTNKLFGHTKAIFVKKGVKDSQTPDVYGGNLKFTKSHIEELDNRYPNIGFDSIKSLYNEDVAKDLNYESKHANHPEVKVPMPIHAPAEAPQIVPEVADIPLSAYEDINTNIDLSGQDHDWLSDIPDYPNPHEDEENIANNMTHTMNQDYDVPEIEHSDISVPVSVQENNESNDLPVRIIELLKIKGSPGLGNGEKRTAKKTLSPEEIANELKVDVADVDSAIKLLEEKQVNPLYVRDFGDRKVFGIDYKVAYEDLLNLKVFDLKNKEHTKVLSLFNKTNPENHYSIKQESSLDNAAKQVKKAAERVDVAEELCPKALREIEKLIPDEIFSELRKLATDNPEQLIEWLKKDKNNSSNKSGLKI